MLFPVGLNLIATTPKAPSSPRLLKLQSENGKHQLELKADSLLYLKSEGNYVEVYYTSGEAIKTELIRNSLKNLEQSLRGFPQIKRCHRSYLVNMQRINRSRMKNSKIELDLGHGQVPVSPKYQTDFS